MFATCLFIDAFEGLVKVHRWQSDWLQKLLIFICNWIRFTVILLSRACGGHIFPYVKYDVNFSSF